MGTVITKRGRQLLAKLVASGTSLAITKACVGAGEVPKGIDPSDMIALNDYRFDGILSDCTSFNDIASITFQIQSENVLSGFVITEAGVFAEDPDLGEILYAYLDMGKDPQYIYAAGGSCAKFVEITLDIIIGEAEKVTAIVNPKSLVKKETFDLFTERVNGVFSKLKEICFSGKASDADQDSAHRMVTDSEKEKLEGVAAGAEVNVQADWNVTDTASDAHIKNKPSAFPPANHTHGNATITDVDASKIKTGVIDIERLPKGALERCVVVANDAARFALTAASAQTGDTVKVTDTGLMYFVIDDRKLSTEAGYTEYTAGQASAVPWSGVTGKPSVFPPSGHSHDDKVTAANGDISNTKIASFTASTAAYLVPAAGDTIRVAFGKVKKFFEDINNLRASMLFIGNLVNNGQTTVPGFALDARYGKTLADQLTQLNSDLEVKNITRVCLKT